METCSPSTMGARRSNHSQVLLRLKTKKTRLQEGEQIGHGEDEDAGDQSRRSTQWHMPRQESRGDAEPPLLGGVAFVEVVGIHRRGSGAWTVQARSTFARVGSPPSGNGRGPSASDSETFGKHEGCEKLNHERLEGEDPEELASKRSLEMEPDRERLSFGCKGQLLDSSPRNRRMPELLRPTSRDRDAR